MTNFINVISEPGLYQSLRDENEYVVNWDNDLIIYTVNNKISRVNVCLLRNVLFKKIEDKEFVLYFYKKEN